MVVWVAVRLARLATVAKNLHSQRRFSAMQAHPTLTLTLTLTLTVTLTLTLPQAFISDMSRRFASTQQLLQQPAAQAHAPTPP